MKINGIEKIKTVLNQYGFRATEQRMELMVILSANHKPITLKEILKKMKGNTIHEVTLYRILASFKEAGLVRQVDLQDTVPYFELVDEENDHHHIICTNCKKVSDFVGCEVATLAKSALLQAKDFKSISTHSFELFGLCNKCSK